MIPRSWCPDLPPVERIARLLLNERMPEMRFDVVDEAGTRARLSTSMAGHLLPEVMERRSVLLAEEVRRVRFVLDFLVEETSLARLHV